MAFSLRKIISNIGYFKKPDGDDQIECHNDLDYANKQRNTEITASDAEAFNIDFECTEPDSTSIQNSNLSAPQSSKSFTTKKSSLSETDLLKPKPGSKKAKKKLKKLKIDIKKANQSMEEGLNRENVENTPKHVLLECKSSEIFSERMKLFDFSKSFEIDSDNSSLDEDIDIESLSEEDISLESDCKNSKFIKMCRKVSDSNISDEIQVIPSATPESFGDVELDKNDNQRLAVLMNYQEKFQKMEDFLKKLLTDFQFHIEVSKIFDADDAVGLSAPEGSNIPKLLGEAMNVDNLSRCISPAESWNALMEEQDSKTKHQLKNQLLSIQCLINQFVTTYLRMQEHTGQKMKPYLTKNQRSITYDLFKGKILRKQRVNNKKRIKHFDFPDIREAMLNLFCMENLEATVVIPEEHKCGCNCHGSPSETDSGMKEDRSMSITSSIGNFTLDSTTLSAYSESLDQIISYNSFEDSSLYCSLLQKAAIERITFYVQVHSIQIKCESSEDFESKAAITFHCPACKTTETEEHGLLKHILSQIHSEKIHFLYKTAYIKNCVKAGKEIQPSTVLNPMKMYRDDNKIVCFGDAMYACSLCFENLIVGESVLMSHIMESEHVDRRDKLSEVLD